MRTSTFLRSTFLALLLAGCSGDPPTAGGFTDEDAAVDGDEDTGPLPSFDVPSDEDPTIDAVVEDQAPPPIDRGTSVDRGTTVDNGTTTDRSMPVDNGPPGMCPASCRAEADCNPCRMPGDPGNYCCISGLCLYMSGACTIPSDVPPGGDPDADGGGGFGGDAGGGADGDTGGGGGGLG